MLTVYIKTTTRQVKKLKHLLKIILFFYVIYHIGFSNDTTRKMVNVASKKVTGMFSNKCPTDQVVKSDINYLQTEHIFFRKARKLMHSYNTQKFMIFDLCRS